MKGIEVFNLFSILSHLTIEYSNGDVESGDRLIEAIKKEDMQAAYLDGDKAIVASKDDITFFISKSSRINWFLSPIVRIKRKKRYITRIGYDEEL